MNLDFLVPKSDKRIHMPASLFGCEMGTSNIKCPNRIPDVLPYSTMAPPLLFRPQT